MRTKEYFINSESIYGWTPYNTQILPACDSLISLYERLALYVAIIIYNNRNVNIEVEFVDVILLLSPPNLIILECMCSKTQMAKKFENFN
jgi:hypothetical protein